MVRFTVGHMIIKDGIYQILAAGLRVFQNRRCQLIDFISIQTPPATLFQKSDWQQILQLSLPLLETLGNSDGKPCGILLTCSQIVLPLPNPAGVLLFVNLYK